MSLSKLSASYRCINSIGNSLKLDEMMKEFIKTFVKETDALKGTFFVKKDQLCTEVISVGKKVVYDIKVIEEVFENKKIIVEKFNVNIILLGYKLDKGCLVFLYDISNDVDFNISILDSLENKLNINIDSCLNVEMLENKNEELKKRKQELEEITKNLKEEITEATKANLEKEKQIYDQLKMSQMGELIGNIAHQWRQPLSVISTAASGMQIKKELNMLTDCDFKEYTKSIIDTSQNLSNTIDEFRDYIKDSSMVKEVVVQERLTMALSMVESSFSINNIKFIPGFIEEEKLFFRLVRGDLLQVLISILNNAKDVLLANEKEEKWIKYELYKKEYTILITIEDNGGGIDEKIIDKVFNPYFTTKHKSQGTGIGLYSSYDIVTNKLNGKLYVKNSEHGAKFHIELPFNMNYVI